MKCLVVIIAISCLGCTTTPNTNIDQDTEIKIRRIYFEIFGNPFETISLITDLSEMVFDRLQSHIDEFNSNWTKTHPTDR
jgi:hypothetical protein